MKIIMKLKKVVLLLALATMFVSLSGCSFNNKKENDDNKIKIVATNFPCYDFARAICKTDEDIELTMLLKPGVESHSYDPTPQDIVKIQEADVFIYVGGESDTWANKVLKSLDSSKLEVIKMSDFAQMIPEAEDIEEHEHEHDITHDIEYDEHVWTSPINSIKIIEGIAKVLEEKYTDKKEMFEKNKNDYIDEIKKIDEEFKEIFKDENNREMIVADRFPFIYFTNEYNIKYYAAFPGCSSETEVSAKTLSKLIDKIKEDDIKSVFYIEMSNQKVASTLKEQTGVNTVLFHTAHNVSKEELESGETYVSIMKANIERMKKAFTNNVEKIKEDK